MPVSRQHPVPTLTTGPNASDILFLFSFPQPSHTYLSSPLAFLRSAVILEMYVFCSPVGRYWLRFAKTTKMRRRAQQMRLPEYARACLEANPQSPTPATSQGNRQ